MARRILALAVALLCGGIGLVGCTTSETRLPEGVTLSVFQNRSDYGARALEIKVSNGTDARLTITGASFESTRFAEPAVWDRSQEIPAGAARDLVVQLPDPVCDDADPVDSVTISFLLPGGGSGTATLTPSDEQGRVDAINDEDCLAHSAAAVAEITPAASLGWMPGARAPSTLDLTVRPTGGVGTLSILDAKGTVLLALVDVAGLPVIATPVDRVIDARDPESVIRLSIVPNRCDPHAVQEDKRGTFFPIDVETGDGRSGILYIAVGDDVRRELYGFYADYCGFAAS